MVTGDRPSTTIPKWSLALLSEEDAQKISLAVAEAEKNTLGEIVPIIVKSSSTLGNLKETLMFMLLSIFMIGELQYMPIFDFAGQALVTGVLFGVAAVLAILLSKSLWIQRILLPKKDQILQVSRRAELEFYHAGVQSTKMKTGILLFLSVMEKRAVVLADQAINSKVPKETWDQVCQMMIEGIKKGETAEGICKAIQRSGELLAKEFPAPSESGKNDQNNPNELSNQLILKE